ncbi:phosphotriesterase family protein [Pseudonocardia sp. CA-142604]|uniref:phosphotriesterase family protein n=1 Tax=Pseudonocardia sp. CA-142604 TaxID=3240024 RepID=UPI003D8A172B
MTHVDTVRGAAGTDTLGRVLMHEHVFILTSDINYNFPEISGWEEDKRVDEAVERLASLRDAGIGTIVDLTVLNMGRFIPRLQKINEKVDINIIAATGLYTFDALPTFLSAVGPGTRLGGEEPMIEMFVKDIVGGIADTGVKAAILKCCTDQPGITPGVERVLRAVAAAHRETGVPISTHTDSHTRRGLDQQDFFEREGVDLSRVVIGHSGDTTDLDYLTEIIRRGSYLGMDRFGMDLLLPFEDRVQVVATLCERGFADRMVLSHDASCYMDWSPAERVPDALRMPNWHYNHISKDVIPALKARGVTDEQLDEMLINNPRRIFEAPRESY